MAMYAAWAAALLGGIAAACIGGSYYISERVLNNKVRPDEEILSRELDRALVERRRAEALASSRIDLRSPYGYRLRAHFVPADGGETKRTVVFVHGVTSSLSGMLKYAEPFLAGGFNALFYDHRRHGGSEGRFTTYGVMEKEDLRAAVDWIFSRHGEGAVVGLFGESMGAATALELAAVDDRPAFVISDCAYSDFTEQLAYRMRVEKGLPAFPLLPLASLWCKLRAGWFLSEASPRRAAARMRAPVLFIHGLADDYVPYKSAKELFECAASERKELYLVPNAAHAESFAADRIEYIRRVKAFLDACGFPLKPPAKMHEKPSGCSGT